MPDPSSKLATFIAELKRRRVFRVAVVYAGVAFILVQIVDGTFDPMGIPVWVSRLIILLLALGFPIAVALAWAFDITEKGIVRTKGKAHTPATSRRPILTNWTLGIVAALAIIVAAWSWWGRPAAVTLDKSIAVLPFVNFSDSKDDEYFSDGITDDILTHLSKIGDLKVIARTSIMQYKNTEKRIRDIGRELGVATILEGSVRRADGRVRISSQLVDAETEEHLWAETYDRDMIDIFAIQSDVARQIAAALKATLTLEEKDYVEQRPTDNLEAYDLYLQANYYSISSDLSKSDLMMAVGLYEQAIGLDPTFALAYARLSLTHTNLYMAWEQEARERAQQAKQAVEQALQLAPDLPEAHLALGTYYNVVDLDYERALEEFDRAQKGLTNNSELLAAIAWVQMRQGKWDQALSNYQKAATIDPLSPLRAFDLADVCLYMRKYPEVELFINRAIALAPGAHSYHAQKTLLYLLWDGSIEKARQVIREATNHVDPVEVMSSLYAGLIRGTGFWRFGLFETDIELVLRQYPKTSMAANREAYYFGMAELYKLMGQPDSSRAYYDSVRIFIENKLPSFQENYELHAMLGYACAHLGLKEKAIREGERAMELLPFSDCHW